MRLEIWIGYEDMNTYEVVLLLDVPLPFLCKYRRLDLLYSVN